jgi:hypothetical protein
MTEQESVDRTSFLIIPHGAKPCSGCLFTQTGLAKWIRFPKPCQSLNSSLTDRKPPPKKWPTCRIQTATAKTAILVIRRNHNKLIYKAQAKHQFCMCYLSDDFPKIALTILRDKACTQLNPDSTEKGN